jgi:ADP-ribose pyrophosphatase YjhB (NUDIX family)
VRYRRVIDVYGVCVDEQGRTLMVGPPWTLPGGRVEHGEHPADALARWVRGQTGRAVEAVALREVVTDIDDRVHHDVLVFTITVSAVFAGAGGTWRAPEDDGTAPLTARLLGLVAAENHQRTPGVKVHWPRSRVQRFAAYGLATDPDGNVLLTLISDRYPGAGRWHLPGGGTDFGESPAVGLTREIVEETGQHGRIVELMAVSHRYQKDARGPEGRAMDWHGVRVVYRVRIDNPTQPEVVDHGGSTSAAAWFTPDEAVALPLTEVAQDALAQLRAGDR